MSEAENQYFIILFGSMIFAFLLLVFVFVITYAHQKRQRKNREKVSQLKTEYEKTLSEIKQEIQNETLSFVGKELHDNIGQLLSLIKLNLNSSKAEKISESKELVSMAIREVRTLSKSLDMDWVDEITLDEFIPNELAKIDSTGFCKTHFRSDHSLNELGRDKKLVLIRSIQECFNNAIKHSSPSKISVTIKRESSIGKVEIKDDGMGFDLTKKTDGSGLANLKKRIETVGGYVHINSQKEKGTFITFSLSLS